MMAAPITVVQRALEAAADRLFREAADAQTGGAMAKDVTPGQRRGAAMFALHERWTVRMRPVHHAGNRIVREVSVSVQRHGVINRIEASP